MIHKNILIKLFQVCISICTFFCFPQKNDLADALESVRNGNLNTFERVLRLSDTSKLNDFNKATWLYYCADLELSKGNHTVAYVAILDAENLFEKLNQTYDLINCIVLEIAILSRESKLNYNYSKRINKLKELALKENNIDELIAAYQSIAINYMDADNAEDSILFFRKTIPLALDLKDTVRVGHAYTNMAAVYNIITKDFDSALYYNKKAEPILKRYNDNQSLAFNYNNTAQVYEELKKYEKAIHYYIKADSISLKKNDINSKIIFFQKISNLLIESNKYEQAARYLNKLIRLKDSINNHGQNVAIEVFNNERLKAKIELSDTQSKYKRKIVLLVLGFLVFGSIILSVIQIINKRKQKWVEHEKALESQKLATVLKEQELMAIDAMIEGQEKERQRIANDLHDDLGGLMANVKLHFNALKDKESEELYDKTSQLIDSAYDKVRSVAHAKNSGVIAKEGLLKSVQHMADKVSKSNQLQIDVIDHGLEQRLENSLELTLFRIIQELTTNIIKHAEASEATIHLTQHEGSLNILVEDNGKGFNPSQVTKNKAGMGISSIDKRVAHLEGSMTIESEPKKGTTIIIDIPV